MSRFSFVVWLPIVAFFGVDAHWNMGMGGGGGYPGYFRNPQYSYQARQPPVQPQQPGYQIVEGTLSQLNQLDTQWICTNQKTGDMIVIGTENTDGKKNTGGNPFLENARPRPQQPQQPQEPVYPQRPQQHQQPQEPVYPQRPQPQYPQHPQYPQYPQQQNHQQQVPQVPQQQVPQVPQQQVPHVPQQQVPQVPQQQLPQLNPQHQVPQFNPQQQIPQKPQQPLNPPAQQPQRPQQQVPEFNQQQPQQQSQRPQQPPQKPGFPQLPTTTPDPFQKFDNIDWTSYVTTAAPQTTLDESAYNGQGLIDPRLGTRD